MSFVTKPVICLAASAAVVFASGTARAQEPKVRISAGVGVTAGAIDSEPALQVSAGYRFSNRFSFEAEVTGADSAADRFSILPFSTGNTAISTSARVGSITSVGRGENIGRGGVVLPNIGVTTFPALPYPIISEGSTVLTTVGFRYHIPSSDTRFRPYVSGGLGVSITDEHFTFGFLAADVRGGPPPNTNLFDESNTHTGVAATAGVGASVRVFKQLSVGVDARYYRLDRSRNLGTFGGSVSYGF
jgi:opacity protein-like surface antigen